MELDLTPDEQHALCEPYFPTPPPDSDLLKVLKKIFKQEQFRPIQLDAIRPVISGRDCFVRMATGSGKSLLWQLPAVMQDGRRHSAANSLTVVICPTISLILDQMARLANLGPEVEAVCLYRGQRHDDDIFSMWLLSCHDILPHCLLITPERLENYVFINRLETIYKAGRLARFVIDEADKFLDWGQSFRESYLRLTNLRKRFPDIPLLAMSGSITHKDLMESIKLLGMQHCVQVYGSLDRPNLIYEVRPKRKASHSIVLDIEKLSRGGHGIVYCRTVKDTGDVAGKLRHRSIRAEVYHSQLTSEKQKQTLDSWRKGTTRVVVATSAFGMGIDKSDVRWVVHYTLPNSIEAWFQESGRAGRDGLQAHCIAYFRIEDYREVRQLILHHAQSGKVFSRLERLHQLTALMLDYTSCRRQQLLAHFGENYPRQRCNACDYCLSGWQTNWSVQNVTIDARNVVELLYGMRGIKGHPNWTERQLASAIRGEQSCEDEVKALRGFGCQLVLACGKSATRSEIMTFLMLLINKQVLTEYSVPGKTLRCYIEPGPRAREIIEMTYTIEMPIKQPQYQPLVIQERHRQTGRMIDVVVIDAD